MGRNAEKEENMFIYAFQWGKKMLKLRHFLGTSPTTSQKNKKTMLKLSHFLGTRPTTSQKTQKKPKKNQKQSPTPSYAVRDQVIFSTPPLKKKLDPLLCRLGLSHFFSTPPSIALPT